MCFVVIISSYIFQLICDELSISNGDKEKIHPNSEESEESEESEKSKGSEDSEESELEKTLKIINNKCWMSWLVLAASSLFDEDGGGAVPEDSLERLAERSGYKAVRLKNVMRNTTSISSAFEPDTIGTYNTSITIEKLISVGSCSTVSGVKPTWYLYKYTKNSEDVNFVNYQVIAECVKSYLKKNKREKTVILCDWGISPRQVKSLLTPETGTPETETPETETPDTETPDTETPDTPDVTLYDAGVQEFGYCSKPRHYTADLDRQRKDLEHWIQGGSSVLVTHDVMYRGCEAETIVFISDRWGGRGRQARSGPTRAVSQLCLVTSEYFKINQGEEIIQEIKQYFDLIKYDE